MNIHDMLDQLKQEDPAPETEAIKANIKKIVKICNDKYYNQSFFGSAALNRKMLLDPLITDLATPEVIRYLFTNNATKREMIVRNSGGNIALRDAIYHAFDDGLETIRLMPNNESQYGVNAYQRQKEAYEKHSKRMIQHIKVACQCDTAEVEDIVIAPNHPSLIDKLDHVVKVIEQITLNKASNKLLSVPGYRPTDIRKQTWRGLNRLCKIAGIKYGPYGAIAGIPSLDAFCEQILKSPEALLHGDVIHLFYDRAHLEAGLSARFGVSIAGKTYFYQDILRMMIKKIQKNPTWYPEAHEQFTVRLSIVANDLSRRFPDEIKMVYAASPTSSITLENALNEQDWEAILKIVHTKKLQEDDLKKIEQKAAAYGEWGLIYQCEKQKHPTERILTQGPLQKSLYTLQLEELTRKLLQTNQYQLVYLQNEQYILLQDGTRYNLSKILKYANFEHLNFTETDFNHYYRYHQSESKDKSNLFSWDCGYAPYKKLKKMYPELSKAEMLAINLYTTNKSAFMNGFMRGNIHPYYGVYTPIRDVLLHSVMCASGLSKLPETNIQESHRYENLFDLNEHRNRIRAATEKGVISLSGFVSTTVDGCEILSSQITPTMDNLKTFHLKYGTAYIVTPHKIFYISKSTHNSNATIKSLKVSSTHRNNLNKNIKPNERRTLTHDELNQMWQYTALHHKELYKPYSNVHFTFKNLRGKYIAPLSMFSYENEFLVSPTDVQIEQFHQSGERSYFTCSPVRPLDAQNVRKTFTLQEQDTLQDLEDYLHQQITALTPPSEKLVAFKDCLKKVTALKKNPTSNKAYTKKIIALTEKIKNIDKKAFQTVSGDIFSFVIELLKQEKIVLSKEESDTLQNNTELQQAIIIFVLSCHKLHHDKLSTSKKNALKQYQIDTIKLSLKGADAFINGYACLQNKVLSSIHDNAIVRGIRQFFYLLLIPFTSMKLNTIHTLLDVCSRDDLQQRLIVAQQKINLSIFKTKKSESPPSAPPKPPLTHK